MVVSSSDNMLVQATPSTLTPRRKDHRSPSPVHDLVPSLEFLSILFATKAEVDEFITEFQHAKGQDGAPPLYKTSTNTTVGGGSPLLGSPNLGDTSPSHSEATSPGGTIGISPSSSSYRFGLPLPASNSASGAPMPGLGLIGSSSLSASPPSMKRSNLGLSSGSGSPLAGTTPPSGLRHYHSGQSASEDLGKVEEDVQMENAEKSTDTGGNVDEDAYSKEVDEGLFQYEKHV
jgi:hypothetical protein